MALPPEPPPTDGAGVSPSVLAWDRAPSSSAAPSPPLRSSGPSEIAPAELSPATATMPAAMAAPIGTGDTKGMRGSNGRERRLTGAGAGASSASASFSSRVLASPSAMKGCRAANGISRR